ncbi:MAG: hypothetical protein MUF80_10940 [Burkholderiales bacterium]|jgi:hypothetical protein|nr:hypothetical protein [Burkholderiales bacterium]
MAIDKSELKRIISVMKSGKIPTDQGNANPRPPVASPKRRAAAAMVDLVLQKAGLDGAKFGKLVAEDQRALRADFAKERAIAAKNMRASSATFRSAMTARREAAKLLGAPFIPAIVSLDKPFLIWQLPNPQLNIFIDSHVESMNSFVRVRVNDPTASNSTRFVFFFLWSNETDSFAVVNIRSSLIVNGGCSVQAKSGIFSGAVETLNINAQLAIIRWFGWGMDPVTGTSNDQTAHPAFQPTQRQAIAFLRAEGGHIFQGASFKSQSFSFEQFALSHRQLVVPNRASVVFHVSLELSYNPEDGLDLENNIDVDFSERGSAVFCPNLELEVLTPLSGLTANQAINSLILG